MPGTECGRLGWIASPLARNCLFRDWYRSVVPAESGRRIRGGHPGSGADEATVSQWVDEATVVIVVLHPLSQSLDELTGLPAVAGTPADNPKQ